MADDASIYVFHADTEGLNFRKAFVLWSSFFVTFVAKKFIGLLLG